MNATTSPKTVDPKASDAVSAPAPVKMRRGKRTVLMLMLPLALLVGAGTLWLTGGRYETTENANLHQARVAITSDLSGRVVRVEIADNQPVKAGDVLFQVDPEPLQLTLAQARAEVEAARLKVEQLKVSYALAVSQAALAADDAEFQQAELVRQRTLSAKGVATATSLDDALHLARRARELHEAANQNVASAASALGGAPEAATDGHPMVKAATVARDRAAYNLGLTTVTAPADGLIYQAASFKVGQYVTAGQSLFALVETGDSWVDANFKETQLDGIAPGQAATVTFDIAPDIAVPAHVEAIGAGTGAEFSLLPAQNATGNWVKVTQRVPVRLRLDQEVGALGLASGLSASVSIDTRRHRSLSDLLPNAIANR